MLSVIIPFYNETASFTVLLGRLRPVLGSTGMPFEILIVDNGSTIDESTILRDLISATPECRVVRLSRNFGYQGALWAGLDRAKGDPIIFMDADGEDPPELIPEFLAKYAEGYQVVYGVRRSRKVKWFYNLLYKIFYRVLDFFSATRIPLDAGEFSLISGPALKAIRKFHDRTRMLRILRAWVGFRQIGVPYDRESRIAGESKFGFFRAFSFAWDGFSSATDIPVHMAIACSLGCLTVSLLGVVYYLFWYFFGNEKIPGFASLNISMLFLFSILFACVAVLSRYVITLLDETRRRPPYLVDEDSEDK